MIYKYNINYIYIYIFILETVNALNIMEIVKAAQLRCRVTVSHNHPVNFVNEIHKMLDNFVISNPFYAIFIRSDAFNNLPSLK